MGHFLRMFTTPITVFLLIVATLYLSEGRVLEERTSLAPPGDLVTSSDDVTSEHVQLTNEKTGSASGELDASDVTEDNSTSGLAIDEILMLAGSEVSGGGLSGEVKELDMRLTREQDRAIHGHHTGRHTRKAHARLYYRWPQARVVYRRSPGSFTGGQWKVVLAAIQEWERLTCLTFHHDLAQTQRDHALFVNEPGCSSYVGWIGGEQKITLGRNCVHHRVVLHEIGHAIGFWHEQSRPDRDAYIRVLTENVDERWLSQFDKHPDHLVNNYSVPYDLLSVMHYGQYAATRNWQKTIVSLDPALQGVFGTVPHLSFYDVMLANRMYQCDAGCDPSIVCPRDAFKGKDCKCYCRGPSNTVTVQECGGSEGTVAPGRPTTPRPSNCVDLSRACNSWMSASKSLCQRQSIRSQCPKSCDSCPSIEVTTRQPTTTTTAQTTSTAKTTSTTTTTTTPTTTTTTTTTPTTTSSTTQRPTPESCIDQIPSCPYLASSPLNYCLHHNTVKRFCKKSCGFCDDVRKTTKQATTTEISTKPTITTQRTTTTRNPCKDANRYWRACAHWASVPGLCRNYSRVQELCQYSCGLCTV